MAEYGAVHCGVILKILKAIDLVEIYIFTAFGMTLEYGVYASRAIRYFDYAMPLYMVLGGGEKSLISLVRDPGYNKKKYSDRKLICLLGRVVW